MTAIAVRPFASGEWRTYRALRISALRDAPDAFATTAAEALARPEAAWMDRLPDGPERHLALVGLVDEVPSGLAWGMLDPEVPEVAHVAQMWVAPGARGRGLARMLLQAIIDWARAASLHALELGVTQGNAPAIRLYRSAGFRDFGDPEPLRTGSTLLVQPMRLDL
jgi:ribosomal protein S18 acetylase RimI-like enzyme